MGDPLYPSLYQVKRTWGRRAAPFWPEAIRPVRERRPAFCFMAEAYRGLEWTMLQLGFDCAYDKRLYDRLRDGHARPVREHLLAGLDCQRRCARFLENHDEPGAAATFPAPTHEAAAAVTYLTPGLRFFHDGQLQGRRKRISPHPVRAPAEPDDRELHRFSDGLLAVLRHPAARDGQWRLLDCQPAWDGNWTWDGLIEWAWEAPDGQRRLRLPFADLAGRRAQVEDLLSTARDDREGSDLVSRGLYLDLPPWGYHAFAVSAA